MRAATSLSVSIPHDVTDRMYLGTAVANCYLLILLIKIVRVPYMGMQQSLYGTYNMHLKL